MHFFNFSVKLSNYSGQKLIFSLFFDIFKVHKENYKDKRLVKLSQKGYSEKSEQLLRTKDEFSRFFKES